MISTLLIRHAVINMEKTNDAEERKGIKHKKIKKGTGNGSFFDLILLLVFLIND